MCEFHIPIPYLRAETAMMKRFISSEKSSVVDTLESVPSVNGPATYALTGVEVGACQKPQLADYVPAAYWLSG